jgi:hypothetical protein
MILRGNSYYLLKQYQPVDICDGKVLFSLRYGLNSYYLGHLRLRTVALSGLACLQLDRRFAGSDPTENEGFLRAIKIRSTPSFGWEVRRRSHVVRFYGMLKIPWGISDTDRQNSHSFEHSSYLPQMSLLVGLP